MNSSVNSLPAGRPDSLDAAPSHVLWVELSTRITTQPLHYRSGHEEAAAKSVYELFKLTRELMEKNPGANVFCQIGLKLLNDVLRPYTARWHGWMTGSEDEGNKEATRFRDENVRRKFRFELRELKMLLTGYQRTFFALAQGKERDPVWLDPDKL